MQRVIKVRRDYNSWVGSETLEDYALRFAPQRFRKWSEWRVANTAFGAASFLVLEAVDTETQAAVLKLFPAPRTQVTALAALPDVASTVRLLSLLRHLRLIPRRLRPRHGLLHPPQVSRRPDRPREFFGRKLMQINLAS